MQIVCTIVKNSHKVFKTKYMTLFFAYKVHRFMKNR